MDVAGKPRVVLRVVDDTKANLAYFDGEKWVVVEGQYIPAGWIVMTPALLKE